MRTVLLLALAGAAVSVALVAGSTALSAGAVGTLILNGALGFVPEWSVARLRKVGRRTVGADGTGDDRSCDSTGTATIVVIATRTLLLGERGGQRGVQLLALTTQPVGTVAPRVHAQRHESSLRVWATIVLSQM